MSPYRIVYGKDRHLPLALEHRAYWAVKQLTVNVEKAGAQRKLQLNELEEIRNDAYDCVKHYKDRMKRYHDKHTLRNFFSPGQKILLYNSRLPFFLENLRTRWTCPFTVRTVYPYRAVEVENPRNGEVFRVNGQKLKPFLKL